MKGHFLLLNALIAVLMLSAGCFGGGASDRPAGDAATSAPTATPAAVAAPAAVTPEPAATDTLDRDNKCRHDRHGDYKRYGKQ